jgi:hypothetical protein
MATALQVVRGVTILIILAAIGSCYASLPEQKPLTPEEQAAKDAAEKMLSALIRCENKTKESLADPEGFDPEPHSQWLMQEASEDRYVLSFKARAKNSFGALVWGEFECTATFDGERWIAEVQVL